MKVVLKIVPVAIGEKSKKGKVQVCAIVVDDITTRDDKTGLFCSGQVSAPQILNFWTTYEIVKTFTINNFVNSISDVSVDRAGNLNVRIKQVQFEGEYVDVGGAVEEEGEE